MPRPVLYVLAGVNGAGKSSIGGYLLERAGSTWFNPDDFAHELVTASGCDQAWANAQAWAEGMRRLDDALAHRRSFAFETTLGGRTVVRRIRAAARTHDVLIWFCGLASPDQHVRRVRARAAAGGHDIPEAMIRERYPRAIVNLVALMPDLAHLRVYDNSLDAAPGGALPDPLLVMEMRSGTLTWPAHDDRAALARTPGWAKAILEAGLSTSRRGRGRKSP